MPEIMPYDEWKRKKDEEIEAKKAKRKKTPEQKKAQNLAWKREHSVVVQVRMAKSSGIPDLLKKATQDNNVQAATYLRKALLEKLQRDGYLSEQPQEE